MKIIVTAGGTGGHIYPALAIINKFKEKDKNLDVIYIGTHNRMEKDIIPENNIKYVPLEIYGLSKKDMIRNIKNIFLINKAYKKCKKIITEFKPDVVIGVGGYVTYPVIRAAHAMNVKVFIHEQNSIPGKSNKMLEKYSDLIGVSFESSEKYFKDQSKVFLSGNPCGERGLKMAPYDKSLLGLSRDKKLIVIVAGSLGSQTINSKMKEFLINGHHSSYEIVYITGKNYYEDFISSVKFPKNVKVLPYFDNLISLMKSCDLVITRAGAGILSEITTLDLPSILIPSPYVANNHQYYNALDLVNKSCAVMLEEKELTTEKLEMKINYVLNDSEIYDKMKKSIKSLNTQNSSELIYNKIKEMIKNEHE